MSNDSIDQGQNSHRLTITGLSPMFIGSGNKYSQLDYISHENKIHILDFDKILTQIPFEIIDDLTNDILENFEKNIWRGDVKDFLGKYEVDWNNFVEKSYDLVGKIGKNEINQFIKTGDQIYIPGSSLKGAIRTAILFKILKNHPKKKEEIVQSVLNFFNDREIIRLIQSDGKTDLLRALIISDLKANTENAPIKIVESKVYHIRDQKSTIPIFYEVLDNGFNSTGTLKINRKLVDSNALISQYFDLSKDTIIDATNSFSKEIINYELKEFKSRNDSNLERIINFYEELEEQVNSLKDNECIMRLGQGSSVLGITLFLNFSDNTQVVSKYKGLEDLKRFNFNVPDRNDRSFGIARQGGFTILIDRDSLHRPKLNETWLCRIVATKGNNKFVSLIEKITTSYHIEKEKDKSFLYPLTRKFIVSENEKLISPFGWVKLTWE